MYNHDNDLAGWVVKDIVIEKHLRLIGQETSTQGIFIGGLFYYLQVPFFILSRMDPVGVTLLGAILGGFYTLGVYQIFKNVFNKKVALIASALYSLSYIFVFNDREIVPTQPVIFWSIAFFWGLMEILMGNIKKGLIISAVLVSLIWHLNFALILPVPLILVSLVLSKKHIVFKDLVKPIAVVVILSLPLIIFELRHNFIQTNALISSLVTDQKDIMSGWDKVVRIFHLVSKNYYSLILPPLKFLKYEHIMFCFILLFGYLYKTKKEYRKMFGLLLLWFIIYFLFFSLYSKRVSEYYLSGIQFIPLILLALLFEKFLNLKKFRFWGYCLFVILIIVNLYRFFTIPINRSGYLEKKALVSEIKKDAIQNGYPCLSVSYITDPGYNLGYRYLFWLNGMHVNNSSSGSPVYTIVFPLNDTLFPANRSFGALGLIYPDYSRYTNESVGVSCMGDNSNLTDPMFGFTK